MLKAASIAGACAWNIYLNYCYIFTFSNRVFRVDPAREVFRSISLIIIVVFPDATDRAPRKHTIPVEDRCSTELHARTTTAWCRVGDNISRRSFVSHGGLRPVYPSRARTVHTYLPVACLQPLTQLNPVHRDRSQWWRRTKQLARSVYLRANFEHDAVHRIVNTNTQTRAQL